MKFIPAGVLGAVLALFSAPAAHAQVLLTIDVTHPDAVVITATGATPSGSVSANSFWDGISLINFFTSDVNPSPVAVTTTGLTTGDSSTGPAFDTAQSDETGSETGDVNLTLYKNGDNTPMTFTAGEAAFIGQLIVNLNGTSLKGAGASGELDSGYSQSGTTSIGTWEVVPEPSTWALVAFSLVLLAGFRRIRA